VVMEEAEAVVVVVVEDVVVEDVAVNSGDRR
jgi:hypothetical protein